MMKELLGRVDEMFGAAVLAVIAGVAMYLNYDSGIVNGCVTGIVGLLIAKVVRPDNSPLVEIK